MRLAAFLACMAVLTSSAGAFDWPLPPEAIRYGFGAFRDGFLRGVELGATDGVVRAPEDGELTFMAVGATLPGGFPIPANSLVSIAHGSDVMTVYTGMEASSISRYLKTIARGVVLGRAAYTRESGRGAVFYTFDSRERRYINPLILMPAVNDGKPPVIKSFSLASGKSEIVVEQPRVVRQGTYFLVIDAYDLSPGGFQSAPYSIKVYVDGTEYAAIAYDAAWTKAGISTLFGSVAVQESQYLGSDGRSRFGPLTLPSGKAVVSIFVVDYFGNRREQTYSFTVQ